LARTTGFEAIVVGIDQGGDLANCTDTRRERRIT
jgi:hypothetical protein